jgi:phenol 2-monooxygenase
MAAYWMARCGVKARVIDKRSTKVFVGHADGLRPRTLELFDSMGFQHRVMHEGSISTEANFWVCMPVLLESERRLTFDEKIGTR